MNAQTASEETVEVLHFLRALARIASDLAEGDRKLQDHIGSLAEALPPDEVPLEDLQLIDLHAQMHDDIAAFLNALSAGLAVGRIDAEQLSSALKLDSLRRRLLTTRAVSLRGGEVSLF